MYDGLTARYTFPCPASGEVRVRLSSFRTFERLYAADPDVRFSQYSGRCVRCALMTVENQNRKPVAIRRVDCVLVHFGPDGRIDQAAHRREMQFAVDQLGVMFSPTSEPVVDISPYITSKQSQREFRWTPSDVQIETLHALALTTR